MFLAYASSLKSLDLSRQVGAVVVSKEGEVISTGANDVPKAGGGQYWTDDNPKERDYEKGEDSNQVTRDSLIKEAICKINQYISDTIKSEDLEKLLFQIIQQKKEVFSIEDTQKKLKKLLDIEAIEKEKNQEGKSLLDGSQILDITEYGRIVHAEMEALTACSRIGVSPKGGTLFVTTFPCHNCAKHIVASGIKKVIYIEPYPKSRAKELHSDAIKFKTGGTEENQVPDSKKVVFQPFIGVGPRRFF